MALSSRSSALRPYICSSCAKLVKLRTRSFATAASPDIYDVVCVGGGPAGLSLLTALRSSKATSHLRLAVVESQDLDLGRKWHLPPDQYSNRASSLTNSSRVFLSRIGAWNHIDSSRVQPYHQMRVWDGLSSNGRIAFDSRPSDLPMAYMTENQNLARALLRRLDDLQPISLFDRTSVVNIHLGPPPSCPAPENTSLNLSSYPHVSLSSNRTIAARLLVGADGPNSPVRRFAAINTRGWEYGRHGVVATLKLAPGSTHRSDDLGGVTAYQRFLPTGPIALLALPGDYATLVWTTTLERAAHLKTLNTDDFLAMINAAFRLSAVDLDFMSTLSSGQASEFQWRESVSPSHVLEANCEIPQLVSSVQEGSIASFPLRLRHATTYTTHRIALIGDAAHTIHPLAGQGLNMGLSDAQILANTIEDAVMHGADIGSQIECLDKYNSGAWMQNNRMLGAVDKLHWLFSARSAPIVRLRSWGMSAVNAMEPMKDLFMRQAGGL